MSQVRVPRGVAVIFGMLAMLSVQSGAAVSKKLFSCFGATGVVWFRLAIASIVLCSISMRSILRVDKSHLRTAMLLGVVNGLMTLSYFMAIERIPLAIATCIEFTGPLVVGAVGARSLMPRFGVALALIGILLLTSPWNFHGLNVIGVLCACGAGLGWGCYLVLTKKIAEALPGVSGLALSMVVASVVCMPFVDFTSILSGISKETMFWVLVSALLLPILPYSLEVMALRTLRVSTYGTLMVLEPAMGAIVGAVLLDQLLSPTEISGLICVSVAGFLVLHFDTEKINGRKGPGHGQGR